jgi:hypothetical protein
VTAIHRSLGRATATIVMTALLAAPIARADEAASSSPKAVAIEGAVKTPLRLRESDLRALAPTAISVSFMTGHGQEQGTYTGALLWTVLAQASVIDGSEKGAHLRHVVVVSGHDGYTIALSIGELDPNFEGKSVIIAYDKDGQALPSSEGLRLIVPGDHHGGRAVRDLERIEVR